MQRRNFGALVGATLAAAAWPETAAAQQSSTTLFTITRSKNKNAVVYRAKTHGPELDQHQPLEAYWLMLAEDGRREELGWAERKLAYGFGVSGLSRERCVLSLVAFKQRPVTVERRDKTLRAFTSIAGQPGTLERIFVQTSEGTLLPSVQYLDVFGVGLDGRPLRERISAR
ncbi:MAG TPA: DUF4833 domain-containing protein [Polyangiaceae bacterium]|nr:DUF4833 domain-containing protein [Polyangiaceae bacterium]